jgi:NADH-quinone oxidoreductase subunit J
MNQPILYAFMIIAMLSVGVMLFTRIVFYAALALLACLLCMAAIYALLNAEFLAVTQIIIYAGGVLILLLFGIMLTNRISGKPLLTETQHVGPGLIVFIGLLAVLLIAYSKSTQLPKTLATSSNISIQQTGVELMSTYLAPFELSGILLLVCLIGAAYTAASFKKNEHE